MTAMERASVSTLSLYGRLEAQADEQLERVLAMLAGALGVGTAVVALLDGPGPRFARFVAHGPVDAAAALPLFLCAVAEDDLFVVEDLGATPRFAGVPELREPAAPRRFASLPLRTARGDLHGVLCALDPAPGAFDARAREAMRAAGLVVAGHLASISDVAELRGRHARQLAELHSLRGVLGATAMMAMVTTDALGIIRSVNPAAERCLCARAVDVVGHVPITAFAGDQPGLSLEEVLGEACASDADERDWTYRRRDGSTFVARVAVGAVRDEDGELQGYVFMLQDVTERRRAEQAVRRQRDELANANRELARSTRLKDDFIAGMSRELRTPLNAIMGLAEALEERVYGPLSDEQRKAVAGIRAGGKQLQALGDDVLDLFRAEAQRLELHIAKVHVGDVCRACLQHVQEEARRRHLAVSLRLDEDAGVVDGDGPRLTQNLLTLWLRAIDGASEGGATGLTVTADAAADAVRFTLWDTGVGLTDATRQQLFDAFAPASQDKPAGRAGVGLALARRLIELHHGDIEVESEAGRGTQLTVTIPRHHERVSVPSRRTVF